MFQRLDGFWRGVIVFAAVAGASEAALSQQLPPYIYESRVSPQMPFDQAMSAIRAKDAARPKAQAVKLPERTAAGQVDPRPRSELAPTPGVKTP